MHLSNPPVVNIWKMRTCVWVFHLLIMKAAALSEHATPAVIKQRRESQLLRQLWLIISRNQSLNQWRLQEKHKPLGRNSHGWWSGTPKWKQEGEGVLFDLFQFGEHVQKKHRYMENSGMQVQVQVKIEVDWKKTSTLHFKFVLISKTNWLTGVF